MIVIFSRALSQSMRENRVRLATSRSGPITAPTAANYHSVRPHQSLDNVPLDQAGQPPPEEIAGEIGPIRRHELLGGLLNHYEREAA